MKTYHLTLEDRENEILHKKVIDDLHEYMRTVAGPANIYIDESGSITDNNQTFTFTVPAQYSNFQVY